MGRTPGFRAWDLLGLLYLQLTRIYPQTSMYYSIISLNTPKFLSKVLDICVLSLQLPGHGAATGRRGTAFGADGSGTGGRASDRLLLAVLAASGLI